MNTEVLPYAIESLQKIFKQVCLVCEGGHGFFSVKLDDLEIVNKSDTPSRLNDLLFYDHEELGKITVTIYDLQGEYLNCYEIVEMASDAERFEVSRLKWENELLRKQIIRLSRKEVVEKVDSIKIVEGGDSLVVFIDRKIIHDALNDQVEAAKANLNMVEVIHRYTRRFILKPKT